MSTGAMSAGASYKKQKLNEQMIAQYHPYRLCRITSMCTAGSLWISSTGALGSAASRFDFLRLKDSRNFLKTLGLSKQYERRQIRFVSTPSPAPKYPSWSFLHVDRVSKTWARKFGFYDTSRAVTSEGASVGWERTEGVSQAST